MDDFDIYADLPSIHGEDYDDNDDVDAEANDKEAKQKELEEKTAKLKKYESLNLRLQENFSSLWKTAKAEITRKDRLIAELREKLNNLTFRRNLKQSNYSNPNDRNNFQQNIRAQSQVILPMHAKQNYTNHNHSHNSNQNNNHQNNAANISNETQVTDSHNYVLSVNTEHESYQQPNSYGDNGNTDYKIQSSTRKNFSRNKELFDDSGDDSDDAHINKTQYMSTVYGERLRKKFTQEAELEKKKKDEDERKKNIEFCDKTKTENMPNVQSKNLVKMCKGSIAQLQSAEHHLKIDTKKTFLQSQLKENQLRSNKGDVTAIREDHSITDRKSDSCVQKDGKSLKVTENSFENFSPKKDILKVNKINDEKFPLVNDHLKTVQENIRDLKSIDSSATNNKTVENPLSNKDCHKNEKNCFNIKLEKKDSTKKESVKNLQAQEDVLSIQKQDINSLPEKEESNIDQNELKNLQLKDQSTIHQENALAPKLNKDHWKIPKKSTSHVKSTEESLDIKKQAVKMDQQQKNISKIQDKIIVSLPLKEDLNPNQNNFKKLHPNDHFINHKENSVMSRSNVDQWKIPKKKTSQVQLIEEPLEKKKSTLEDVSEQDFSKNFQQKDHSIIQKKSTDTPLTSYEDHEKIYEASISHVKLNKESEKIKNTVEDFQKQKEDCFEKSKESIQPFPLGKDDCFANKVISVNFEPNEGDLKTDKENITLDKRLEMKINCTFNNKNHLRNYDKRNDYCNPLMQRDRFRNYRDNNRHRNNKYNNKYDEYGIKISSYLNQNDKHDYRKNSNFKTRSRKLSHSPDRNKESFHHHRSRAQERNHFNRNRNKSSHHKSRNRERSKSYDKNIKDVSFKKSKYKNSSPKNDKNNFDNKNLGEVEKFEDEVKSPKHKNKKQSQSKEKTLSEHKKRKASIESVNDDDLDKNLENDVAKIYHKRRKINGIQDAENTVVPETETMKLTRTDENQQKPNDIFAKETNTNNASNDEIEEGEILDSNEENDCGGFIEKENNLTRNLEISTKNMIDKNITTKEIQVDKSDKEHKTTKFKNKSPHKNYETYKKRRTVDDTKHKNEPNLEFFIQNNELKTNIKDSGPNDDMDKNIQNISNKSKLNTTQKEIESELLKKENYVVDISQKVNNDKNILLNKQDNNKSNESSKTQKHDKIQEDIEPISKGNVANQIQLSRPNSNYNIQIDNENKNCNLLKKQKSDLNKHDILCKDSQKNNSPSKNQTDYSNHDLSDEQNSSSSSSSSNSNSSSSSNSSSNSNNSSSSSSSTISKQEKQKSENNDEEQDQKNKHENITLVNDKIDDKPDKLPVKVIKKEVKLKSKVSQVKESKTNDKSDNVKENNTKVISKKEEAKNKSSKVIKNKVKITPKSSIIAIVARKNNSSEMNLIKKSTAAAKPKIAKNVIIVNRRRRPVQLSDSSPVVVVDRSLNKST